MQRIAVNVTGIAFCAFLAGIPLYISLLMTTNIPVSVFHIFFIGATLCSTILLLDRGLSLRIKLAIVIAWVAALHLIAPLRVPSSIIANAPDPWYVKQLADGILRNGAFYFGQGTGEAYLYSFYPVVQSFVAIYALVTGIDAVTLMRYLPTALSVPLVLIVFNYFRRFLSKDGSIIATQIAVSCFWWLNFSSSLIQATFGAFFVALLLFVLTKKSNSWTVIFIVGSLALVLSHFLSSLYFLILLVTAKLYMSIDAHLSNRSSGLPVSTSKLLVMAGIFLAWLTFPAVVASASIVALVRQTLLEITPGGFQFALISTNPSPTPLFQRVLGDAGIVAYGALLLLSFVWIYFRKIPHRIVGLLPYAFGGAVIFGFHIAFFSLGVSTARDLLPRGFFLVYLIGAPLVVFSLSLVRGGSSRYDEGLLALKGSAATNTRAIRTLLGVFIIVIILLPSMYYYFPAYGYDNSAKLDAEAPQLPLVQWLTVAVWSSSHVAMKDLYGDKLAYNFIGGIGQKDISLFPSDGNVTDWLLTSNPKGYIIVLRMSSVNAPYSHFATTADELRLVVGASQVVYNSGDAVFVMVP